MCIVMIKCPDTGVAISTGIKTERSRFNRSPVFFGRTYCTICQTNHEWFAGDAWLQQEADRAEAVTT
jgi:hypothetical protein